MAHGEAKNGRRHGREGHYGDKRRRYDTASSRDTYGNETSRGSPYRDEERGQRDSGFEDGQQQQYHQERRKRSRESYSEIRSVSETRSVSEGRSARSRRGAPHSSRRSNGGGGGSSGYPGYPRQIVAIADRPLAQNLASQSYWVNLWANDQKYNAIWKPYDVMEEDEDGNEEFVENSMVEKAMVWMRQDSGGCRAPAKGAYRLVKLCNIMANGCTFLRELVDASEAARKVRHENPDLKEDYLRAFVAPIAKQCLERFERFEETADVHDEGAEEEDIL